MPVDRKYHAKRGPEARLYTAMGAGLGLVGSLFMYAWCTFPNVHWISLCIAITVRTCDACSPPCRLSSSLTIAHRNIVVHHLPRRLHLSSRLLRHLRVIGTCRSESLKKSVRDGLPALYNADVRQINISLGKHNVRFPGARYGACTLRTYLFLRPSLMLEPLQLTAFYNGTAQVLFFKGPALRSRSKFAKTVVHT